MMIIVIKNTLSSANYSQKVHLGRNKLLLIRKQAKRSTTGTTIGFIGYSFLEDGSVISEKVVARTVGYLLVVIASISEMHFQVIDRTITI